MSDITSANVAQAIVKLVAADALPALVGNLVLGRLVNRDFESALAQYGDTISVPIPPTMVANNIAEGGTVTTQNPNLGSAQIVLNTHAECTFQIPDVTKVLAVPDLMKTFLEPALIAIAEKIETDLLSVYAQFTANAILGGGTAINEASIDAAETALFTNKVPKAQTRFLVVSGSAFSAMRQISRFTDYISVGAMQNDAIVGSGIAGAGPLQADGRIKDVWVFRSQYVPFVTGSPGTYQNQLFTKDAIGMAMRRLPQPLPGTGAIAEYAEMGGYGLRVTMSYQPNTLAQQFTVDALYGVAALRQQFGQLIQST